MSSDATLATVLDFTDEELTLNRSGLLSDRQKKKWHRFLHNQQYGCIGVSGVFSIILVLMILVGLSAKAKPGINSSNSAVVVIAGVLLVILWVVALLFVAFIARRVAGLKVQTATGRVIHEKPVEMRSSKGGISYIYSLKVGDLAFTVPHAIYNVFQEGVAYQVYYLRAVNLTPLSAEIDQ